MSTTASAIRSVADLTAFVEEQGMPKFLFFWGHTQSGRKVDHSCLSNWYPASFEIDGVRYFTTEHHMMAEKARLFDDEETRSRILESDHPGAAKTLGRKVSNFNEAVWAEHRFEIVVAGNLAKFAQNAALGEYLVSTGDRVLVEASPWDPIWGIGLDANQPRAQDPLAWRGLNLLGFALMEVREQLRLARTSEA